MSAALIHALLIDASGKPVPLDWDGVRAWTPEQGFLWIHLNYAEEETRQWIEQQEDLPEVVSSVLLAEETRPRVNTIGDGAILLLRGVNLYPGANPEDMVSIRLWVEAHRIISTRRRRLLSVGDVVDSLQQTPLENSGDLVARLTDRLAQRVGDIIDDTEERVAQMEQAMVEHPDKAMRADLAHLRRETIALRRYLAPQREALGRLQGEKVSWLSDPDRLRLRETNDRLIRYVEDLDAVRERAAVIQEELVSQLSDQLNQRMYVLSVVAAIFLPLGFLTGLLGVNVGGIPGADSELGFPVFLLILVVLVALQMWYFIKKHWF